MMKTEPNQLLKKAGNSLRDISMDTLKNTATRTTANMLKKVMNSSNNGQHDNQKTVSEFYESASQSEIPVKDIRDGIIITSDNRYVGIIEVLPINYFKKSVKEQVGILKNFGNVFKMDLYKFSIKIVSDTSDASELLYNVNRNCRHKDDAKVKCCLADYVNFVRQLGSKGAVVKRYFFIYEYCGIDGEKSYDFKTIVKQMDAVRNDFITYMYDCGNICVDPDNRTRTYVTTDIVYRFFNRLSCRTESLEARYNRLNTDFRKFNEKYGTDKKVTIADMVAPHGLHFTNRNFIYMDCYFYCYVGIDGEQFPVEVEGGWMDVFDYGVNVDVDMIFKRLPKKATMMTLKPMNKITYSSVRENQNKGKKEKAERAYSKFINNQTVYNKMSGGDNLYDVAIILTLRARTISELDDLARRVKSHIKIKLSLGYDESDWCCESYFRMVMPFLYIAQDVFDRLKHNILSSAIESMYPFTSYQLNDPQGCVIGLNEENQSIVSLNPFNTKMYMNANITILGTSGSGKSFTEQVMGRRMFLNGARCFFIIPKKGYEYRDGCEALNGKFISLMPGSEDRINVLDIRPEGELDESAIGDETKKLNSGSWLAHKVVSVCAWVNLLLGTRKMQLKEYNELRRCLMNVYKKKGITNKNESVYADKENKILKEMPTLGDLYRETADNEILEEIHGVLEDFVTGTASNMDGQTNIKLDGSEYVVFDIDEDKISEDFFSAFLYIAFDYVYSEVKENPLSKDIIFLDEVWKMMLVEAAAKQVHNMVKLVRAYGGSTVIATQEMGDFKKSAGDYGLAVLNNSELNIYLAMKPQDADSTQEIMHLPDDITSQIRKLRKGHAIVVSRDNVINVEVLPSKLEYDTFTTDINDRISNAKKQNAS